MIPETADQRYAAFRHGPFLRYLAARFLATFAAQIVSVAVGWQIYDLTRDPFDLGLVGIIQFLPALLLVLVTGAVADRFGRRLIMALSSLPRGLLRTGYPAADSSRLERRRPDLRRPGPVRHRPRLLRAGLQRAGRQSRAAGGFRQCRRLELVRLADCRHRRPGCRRPALRTVSRGRYAIAALLMLVGGLAGAVDPQAGAAAAKREADARHAVCRLPLHLEREDRARRDLARSVRRAAFGRVGAAAGLCARYPGTGPVGPRPVARRARRRRHRRRHLAGRPHDQGPRRRHHARLRRAVRRLHGGVRRLDA